MQCFYMCTTCASSPCITSSVLIYLSLDSFSSIAVTGRNAVKILFIRGTHHKLVVTESANTQTSKALICMCHDCIANRVVSRFTFFLTWHNYRKVLHMFARASAIYYYLAFYMCAKIRLCFICYLSLSLSRH